MRNVALVTLLLTFGACDSAGKGGSQGAPGGFNRPPTYVVTATAMVRDIRDEVEAIGTTRANESVTIAAKVTDTVSKVNFHDGQIIDQGTILVELTNREQQALLDEAGSEYE